MINAVPAAGYSFKNWVIYRHEDGTSTTVNSAETPITVNQSYTCTANFKLRPFNVKVKVSGATGSAFILYNGSSHTSVTVNYKTPLTLSAPTISGYRFLGWKEEGASNYFSSSNSLGITVPAKNVTYVACYESTVKTVRFYDKNGHMFCSRTVNAGASLGGNMPGNPKAVGSIFNGWENGFNANTRVYNDMDVRSTWRSCSSHRVGTCGVPHTISAVKLSSHTSPGKTNVCMCIVCADCGSYLTKSGGRWRTTNSFGWKAPGGRIYISPSVWCISHVSPSGECSSYMNSHSAGTYNPH